LRFDVTVIDAEVRGVLIEVTDAHKQKPRRIGRGFLRSRAGRSRCRYSLPLPPPPAEQATVREDQAGQASADDWAGDGGRRKFSVGDVIGLHSTSQ
jgi:hypothetical protein